MAEQRFTRARVLALQRLSVTARENARRLDDEALDPDQPHVANLVRRALNELADQLERRAKAVHR